MALLRPNGTITMRDVARDIQGRYILNEARSKLRYEPPPMRLNDPDLTTQYDKEARVREKLAKLRVATRML